MSVPALDLGARIVAAATAPGASEIGAWSLEPRSLERLQYGFRFEFRGRRHGPPMTWFESFGR